MEGFRSPELLLTGGKPTVKDVTSQLFDVKGELCSGGPVTDKVDSILEKVEQDRRISSYDIVEELGMDYKTIFIHLKKPGTRVPHEFTTWNWKAIIHYELLPPSKTINLDLNCQRLMGLKQEVEKKLPELINRKGVVFHHDIRQTTSSATQQ
ncbi:hypothetical protein EVAR_43460_1 [Eumeta japonica]|uniref:Mariner Mos1 transposase n=1 Tax=Eumeta variegata TaxID=151549 RepID=A0A4C1YCM9_EUMVA|nr:hypothetical protein EVAR_43460_1 [Eumeta japonica]